MTGSTLLASLAYGSCYVTGLVYHLTYMSEFDIPPDLFRKTSVEYFFYAYLAWLESMPSWLDTIAGDFGPVALLFLLISGTVGLSAILVAASAHSGIKRIQIKLQASRMMHLVGALLAFPLIVTVSLIFLLIALIFLAILPAWIGEQGASKTVARDQAKFSNKCLLSNGKPRCMDLVEDDKVLATGYVLQASERHIALLTSDGVKIFPLNDRVLQLHVADGAKQP